MKTTRAVGCAFLFFAYCGIAHALIVPVSSNAVISASGGASVAAAYGGQAESYSITRSHSNFSSLTDGVSGSAQVEAQNLDDGQALIFGTTLQARSSASQSAQVGTNAISVSSTVTANTPRHPQVGSVSSTARSFAELTFRIDQLSTFELSGSGSYGTEWWFDAKTYRASLTSSNGSQLFQVQERETDSFYFSLAPPITGLMEPGTYTLRTDLIFNAGPFPPGEGHSGNISLLLRVATVPDVGSTALPLGLAVLGLIAVRLRVS